MPDTYFRVYSGLLTPYHKKRIGVALWEFLWCIDRVTSETGQDGQKSGIVLGGSPISYSDVAKDLGIGKSTVKRNFEKLESENYIHLKRTPYGHIITVNKSKKWGAKNEYSDSAKNGTGAENETEGAKNGTQGAENDHSNKDNTETLQGQYNVVVDNVGAKEKEFQNKLDQITDTFMAYRGKPGLPPRASDYDHARTILEAGVSTTEAITGIKQAFENFKPKYNGDEITSLGYCKKIILSNHYAEKQRREAVVNAASSNKFSRNDGQASSQSRGSQKRSITGGQVGWIRPGKRA
ncbi:hypothetical protein ACE1TI_13380 [Alteribacillus sp. JSM 102045]|uniref:hypothetical protein n=1 Tax=Alteribacillus sp. JSM 102045 TaxID=1562101 RepID=UPI0035BF0BE5